MSRQPMGKTLLRNVIRHTDAHNKIQEEMEMWKMRDWEVQTSQRKHLSAAESMRGHMHCDQVSDQSKHISRSTGVSEHDDREAKYWTRQLYEFEAKDPDRWGHSGYKELYPEEFNSNSESSDSKKTASKIKKSKSCKKASISKRSKKSSRKKKKKKKKKEEEGKRKKAQCSSSDSDSDDSGAARDRQRRKGTKSRHKNKKTVKKDTDSSSLDSDSETDKKRRTSSGKKRKADSGKASILEPNSKKEKRRVAGEESSDCSSGD